MGVIIDSAAVCELTLCRSRAVQISMNVSVLEEWVGKMGLPRGVQSHFAPVRDLLNWLQVRNPHRGVLAYGSV